jgi:hypothetical protein
MAKTALQFKAQSWIGFLHAFFVIVAQIRCQVAPFPDGNRDAAGITTNPAML